MTISIMHGSVEFLFLDVTSNIDLDAQPVEVGLGGTGENTATQDVVWFEASWTGDVDTTRTARVLIPGSVDAGSYSIFVRVHDSPEVPVIYVDRLRVKPLPADEVVNT